MASGRRRVRVIAEVARIQCPEVVPVVLERRRPLEDVAHATNGDRAFAVGDPTGCVPSGVLVDVVKSDAGKLKAAVDKSGATPSFINRVNAIIVEFNDATKRHNIEAARQNVEALRNLIKEEVVFSN